MRCDCFDITLEDQEVARFDQDVLGFERVVVCSRKHGAVVDAILALTSRCDAALPPLLLASVVLVHSHDPSSLGIIALRVLSIFLVFAIIRLSSSVRRILAIFLDSIAIRVDFGVFQHATAVDQIPEVGGSQVSGFDAEHEGDGIHRVGLARSIGADDGGEV